MAWSYRSDRIDEVYASKPGVTLVEGKDLPDTPMSSADADEMLKPKKPEQQQDKNGVKGGVVTQHQEHPGQNVPRVIFGEGETTKDKEIVKAAKEQDKEGDAARITVVNNERSRIVMEEREKLRQEELEKEREKLRKEVQAEVKKSATKEHQHEVAGKK
jgi:hypothetical protein